MDKKCKFCKKNKLLTEFSRLTESKDGYLSRCKDCDANRRNRVRINFEHYIKLTDIQKAYLAGFTDGEGYIGLARTVRKRGKYAGNYYYHARMTIASTALEIYKIQNNYGFGKVWSVKSRNKKHKDRHDWAMSSNEIRTILPQIKDFLNIKQRQAQLILDYLNLARTRDNDYRMMAEGIYQQLKLLNKRGRK